jgi:hypothetical protein
LSPSQQQSPLKLLRPSQLNPNRRLSLEFQDREITHFLQTRAWEFLAQWPDLATILLPLRREWAAHLVQVHQDLVVLAALVAQPELEHHVVMVVPRDQAVLQDLPVQDLVLQDQVDLVDQVLAHLEEDRDLVAAVAAALVPLVHLERAARRASLASQSALRRKSLSKEKHRA